MKMAWLSLAGFILCVCAGAQPSDKFTGSLLWKVSGKGLAADSYILGTHHLTSMTFIDSIPGLWKVLETTEQTVAEIDMADMDAMMFEIMVRAAMPEGVTYESLLTPEEYTVLDSCLRSVLKAGLDQLGAMKPAMLNTVVTVATYSGIDPEVLKNPDPDKLIDKYIQIYTKGEGKPVVSLETMDEQISLLFESDPLEVQVEDLLCLVTHIGQNGNALSSQADYYRTGQLDKMYEQTISPDGDPCPMSKKQLDAMLRNRNEKWLEALPSIIAKTPSLIAVGALHLAGQEGLLYRLDEMGYTVEAVID